MLGFDIIDNWYNELKEMNKGKVGEPYHYPNSFLLLLGYARVYFHLPFRQTEGIVRAHAENKIPSIPDYSPIDRRINKLDIHVNNKKLGGNDWSGPLFLGTLFPFSYRYYFLSLPIFITFFFSSSISCCIFHFEINSYGVRYPNAECILFLL